MYNYIFELLTYFIIYSFLGWVMESTVRTISEKKLINTGFMHGPFCPIYGFGAIIIVLFLKKFENQLILLFITSFILLSLWEYIVGMLLEKIFKTKYWDYSDKKFNLKGRVCLANSLCWGVLGVLFIKYIHPCIINLLSFVDIIGKNIIIYILTVLFLIDMIISIVKTKNIQVTLQKVEKLNIQIKDKVQEIKNLEMLSKLENVAKTENIKKIIDKLNVKKDRTLRRLYRRVYRLKRAFPAINTKEITEVLNKRLEILKKDKKGE